MYKTLKYITIPLIIFLIIFTITNKPAKSEDLIIHYIDVGQADSILVELPEKRTMLIDAGNNSDGDMLIKYLQKRKINHIDFLIGTHPHEDHIGGLDDIIDNFQIDKIYLPEVTHTTKTFEDVLLAIQRKNKKITTARAGVNILNDANLKISFLSPISSTYDELNYYSAVIKIDYLNNSFLFTGDAEKINEDEILKVYGGKIKSDILKVGHHGSNSSSSKEFINTVDPDYAVISVGKDNKYGHPSPEIIERLKSNNIEIYRTDLQGTIIANSNGQTITFDQNPVKLQTDIKKTDQTGTKEKSNKNKESTQINNTGVVIGSVDLADEIVVIKNNSENEVNLADWKLLSVKGKQEFIFPQGTIISPGDSIKIISGRNAISNNDKTIIWKKSYIWNNSGDPAELYDNNDNLISSY